MMNTTKENFCGGSIEDALAKIKTYKNNFNVDKYEKLADTFRKIETYIKQYNNTILKQLNTALINALKLDDTIWREIQNKRYYDFFQVRNEDGNLQFTYTLNYNNGLSKRDYCMKSDWRLDLQQLKDFLNNPEATKKLNEISGYEEVLKTIKDITKKLIFIETYTNKNTEPIPITLTTQEDMLFKPDENNLNSNKDTTYNFSSQELIIKGEEYAGSRWTNGNISHIERCMVLTNHKDYIFKESNKQIAKLRKQGKIYKQQEDEIKEKLAKWLMLEAF